VEGLAELAFRRHHAQIYHYLERKTGDPDRAEDLAQEVFADATVALARAEVAPGSLLAWLYTVARRRVADDVRRRRRLDMLLAEDLDALPAPDVDVDDGEAVREALARLAPDQRRIIAMKLLRGYTFSEIAAALGIARPAAKMRLQRALRALRTELEREGVEP